jgi:hypothetical protein
MKAAVLALALTLSGCFTTIGAGAGAGIGYLVGAPVKGALTGGLIGLRADIELARDLQKAFHFLFFWT